MNSRQLTVLLIAALARPFLLTASDWPGWLGPNRDGLGSPSNPTLTSLPAEPRRVWHIKVGPGLAGPVVSEDRVFYLDAQDGKEMLHAIDRGTATELWKAPVDDLFRDAQSAPGPRCTPMVDGDLIYAQSCLGELRCFSTTDGRVRWRVNFTKDFHAETPVEAGQAKGAQRHGFTAAPWVEGERLIALVGDPKGAGIVCFGKRTGNVLWKSVDDQAGNAAPIVTRFGGHGPRQVVAFMADGLVGTSLENGSALWRIPLTTTYGRHVTTPIVVDGVVMVASKEQSLLGVEPTQDPASGHWTAAIKWRTQGVFVNFSSPIAVDGHIYGLGPDKNLFCVDAKTGVIRWSKDGFARQAAEMSHLALVAVGKSLLALTETGELVLVAADASGYRELGRTQVCGSNWCNPAYVDGRIYLRDGKELACLQLSP
jgi:outer membrane protein assembly factor BamB